MDVWLVNLLVSRLVGGLVYLFVCWLVGLVGSMASLLVGWLASRPVDRLVFWLVNGLIGWSIGWWLIWAPVEERDQPQCSPQSWEVATLGPQLMDLIDKRST